MTDPFAPWVVALTHTGFGAGLPMSGRDWWPFFDPPPTLPADVEARLTRSSNPAAKAILDRKSQLEPELSTLEEEGIIALTMFHKGFPSSWIERLGPRVPPVVFLKGDPTFLKTSAVGVAGSRDADDAGLEYTRRLARKVAERRETLVTGGANGVDITAVTAIA